MPPPRILPPPTLWTSRGINTAPSVACTASDHCKRYSSSSSPGRHCQKSCFVAHTRRRIPITYASSSKHAYLSTSVTTPTTSSGPKDATSNEDGSIDRNFWQDRLGKKRSYADMTRKFSRRGDGPGWSEYVRRRMLRVAEAELEEQSWISHQPLPEDSFMASSCYRDVIEALLDRKETLMSAKLVEDWIRFTVVLKDSSQRNSISLPLVGKVVHHLRQQMSGPSSSSSGSHNERFKALASIREACNGSSIDWTAVENIAAQRAAQQHGSEADLLQVLTAELEKIWSRRIAQATPIETILELEQGQDEIEQLTSVRSLLRDFLVHLKQMKKTLSLRELFPSQEIHNSRQSLIVEYFSLLASLARLLEQGFLPFEITFPDPITQFRADVVEWIIKEFCRAPELEQLLETEIRHLKEPQRLKTVENIKRVRATLLSYISDVITISRDGKVLSTEAEQEPGDLRRNLSRRIKLDDHIIASLFRYCLRHLKHSEALVQQFISTVPRMVEEGSKSIRAILTIELSEAILLRDAKREQEVLRLMFHQAGLEVPSVSTSTSEERPQDIGNNLMPLLKEAVAVGHGHRVNVLIRYLVAGGRLRGSSPEVTDPDAEETILTADRIVKLLVPSLPRHFDPSEEIAPSPQEAEILSNSATCLSLLNAAVKTGNFPLAIRFYQYVFSYRNQQSSQLVSMPEADCFFQAVEYMGIALLTGLQQSIRRETSPNLLPGEIRNAMMLHATATKERSSEERANDEGNAQGSVFAPTHLQGDASRQRDRERDPRDLLDDLFDVRSHSRKAYEDLIEHWSTGPRKEKAPIPDGRFYNAVLGTSLWPSLLEIPLPMPPDPDGRAARKPFVSLREPTEYEEWKERLRRLARQEDRHAYQVAAWECIQRLCDDRDGFLYLLVILDDMLRSGLPIPPGYASLLRQVGYTEKFIQQRVQGPEERKNRTLMAGKLAVEKHRGLIRSKKRQRREEAALRASSSMLEPRSRLKEGR